MDTSSFEADMDGWTTGGMDQSFARRAASTPSYGTGPSSSADGTSWASLWSKSGNQGDQWLRATVYAGSGQTTLRYTFVPNAPGE